MKVIGINGGNGVILYPFRKYLTHNFEIRSVFHTPDDIQWKLNFGDIPFHRTIVDFYEKYMLDELVYGKIDIIIGAPDCGHSSILAYSRAKHLSDPLENESLTFFLRSVAIVRPTLFLMENLPKILEMVPLESFQKFFPKYKLIVHTLPVTEWGNSQKTRIRLVMMGIDSSLPEELLKKIQYQLSYVYKVKELKTCEELLEGLDEEDPEFGHIREDIDDIITLYGGFKLSLREIQKFWLNHPKLKRWPVNDKKFTTAPGVYRNLENDYPAVARKANRQFNHMGLQMSPRELARIQGVPDKFKLHFDKSEKTFWINKGRVAVTKTPPYQIGRWFYNQLRKVEELWTLLKNT